MARNNIYGKAKQGLGIALVIDGQQFPAAWVPSSVDFETSVIDVTHAQTENNKATIVAELGEPLEVSGDFQFDPQLEVLFELMRTTGRNQERDIFVMFPKTSTAQGVTHENGYIQMPAGSIGVGTITPDLEGPMTAGFTVAGGLVNNVFGVQKSVAANVPTAISITEADNMSTATILKGDVVATLAVTTGITHGPSIFYDLADSTGTAVADGEVYLEGNFIKAGIDGAGGAAALDIEVSVAGWRAWTEETASDSLVATPCDITIIA